MKIPILLACVCTILSKNKVIGAVIKAPLEIISLDDITPEERKELAYLQHKLGRPKRSGSSSGSGDLLETLKNAIGQGIKNKISEFAQGSASASARLSSSSSGGSSGHDYSHHHHYPPPHESYDHKSLDFWTLKKSILNTLLQAVKAIKGGVIAVKGQLIKGGGYVTSAAGKLISAKGEAITHLGKNIASSAILVPYHGHGHSSSGHAEYGHPHESHYSAPSAPEDIYHGSPSAPGPEYHEADHYPSHHEEHSQHGGHEGILILKKIKGKSHHHHIAEESKIPSFKPIAPKEPSIGTIIGKFLSASTSLDPHYPEPFGNTASADTHHDSPSHSESHHYHEESDHKVPPSAAGYVVNEDPEENKVVYSKKPVSDYDTPFEQEPSYLSQHFEDYAVSASKKNPQAVKSNSVSASSTEKPSGSQELPKPSTSSQSFSQHNFEYPTKAFQSLQSPSSSAAALSSDNYNSYTGNVELPNINDYPNGFPGTPSELIGQSSNGELPASFLSQTSTGVNPFDGTAGLSSNGELPTSFLSQTSIGVNPFDETAGHSSNGELPASFHSQTSTGINPFGQTAIDLSSHHQTAPEYMTQHTFPNEVLRFQKHASKPALHLQTPKEDFHRHTPSHSHKRPTRVVYVDSKPSSSKHKHKSTPPRYTVSSKRPSSSSSSSGRTTNKHKPKQTYDVVRSIGYKLGPNGPQRLT